MNDDPLFVGELSLKNSDTDLNNVLRLCNLEVWKWPRPKLKLNGSVSACRETVEGL
jgi:hypothetical protein